MLQSILHRIGAWIISNNIFQHTYLPTCLPACLAAYLLTLGPWLLLEHRPCTTSLQCLLSWAILSSCCQVSPVYVMSDSRSRRQVISGFRFFLLPRRFHIKFQTIPNFSFSEFPSTFDLLFFANLVNPLYPQNYFMHELINVSIHCSVVLFLTPKRKQ